MIDGRKAFGKIKNYALKNVSKLGMNRCEVPQFHKSHLQDQGLGGGGGKDWEFGISRYKLYLYIDWINNNFPLYSTGNYIQCPERNHMEKNLKNCIYMDNCITLLCSGN